MPLTTGSPARKYAERIVSVLVAMALLGVTPFQAYAASIVHVRWEGLSVVVGKTVSIAMPGGAVINGKAVAVEPDALIVDVKKTTDAASWPKGPSRVPRAALRRFDMQTKGKAFRILGTIVGSGAGFVGGAIVAFLIDGVFSYHTKNSGAKAGVAFAGIWAGGTVGGYFAGNAVDKHWTPVEILP